jgi:hypothetical protein
MQPMFQATSGARASGLDSRMAFRFDRTPARRRFAALHMHNLQQTVLHFVLGEKAVQRHNL